MENRKGNGIFLGVISVATLIVAMIGATFAYFSATTNSEEDAVDLGAYEFKLSLSVMPIYPEGASALVPLNGVSKLKDTAGNYVTRNAEGVLGTSTDESDGISYLEYALNVAEKRCIDDNNMQVCALYQVMIENQAANEVQLSGSIRTSSNNPGSSETATPFQNLTYQALEGNHENATLKTVGEPVTLNHDVDGYTDIADITVPGATIDDQGNVTKKGVGYSYLLIYLNDTAGDENPDNDDQSGEMGATYTGELVYASKSADGSVGSTLSGTFKVAAPTTDPDDNGEDDPADLPTE